MENFDEVCLLIALVLVYSFMHARDFHFQLHAAEDLVAEQQIKAAGDLGKLPDDSPVFDMYDDYWELHKRIEACHGVKPAIHKSQEAPLLAER